METWLRKSWFFQQNMFKNFKDRYWEDLEEVIIRDKIKYALCICYGEQQLETNKYKDLPEKITQKIANHSASEKKTLFSCTFINVRLKDCNKENIECIFWTKNKYTGTYICIDTNCRIYRNWVNFTEDNILPESYIIFPKAGRYTDEIRSDFNYRDLICEESVACSLKTKVKKYVVAGTVAIGTVSALAFTSFSTPVTLAAVISSLLTRFTAVRLGDKSEQEELGLDAAVKITDSCKVKSSEKFLCNSAIELKIGSSIVTVCKAMTTVNGINVFVDVILEYKEKGYHNTKSLELLKFTMNFIFCINASLPLVEKLVEYMSRHSLDNVVCSLSQQASHTFSYVKKGYSIPDDFNFLIQLLFPSALPIVKRITDSPIVKFVCKVIKDIKLQGTKDPVILRTQLAEMLKEIDKYILQSKQEVVNNFGEETGRIIEQWALNDVIDIGNAHSSYEDKMNFPVDLSNKVNEILISLDVIKNKDCLKEKIDLLLNAVMRLVFQHDLKTYAYAIGKASYYCDKFSEIYTMLMDDFYSDHFVTAYKNISVDSTNLDITYELENKQINHLFDETLELLSKSSDQLHHSFQNSSYMAPSQETESVFKFKVPKSNLNEQLCYSTAIKHLQSLSSKLTKDHTIFESYFDQLAIITSNDGKFKLIFYFIENGENLDGLLMYVEFLSQVSLI